MNVDPLSDIGKTEFDYALIAKTNQEDIDRTKNELVEMGVDENKILAINCKALKRNELLEEYLNARKER